MALTKATLIDLNSNELVLDLDADTSITADTDDTIHFKIAGSDEITMTATAIAPSTSDGQALGTSSLMFSDLFLASGSVVNFNNGDVTLTHSSNTLTLGGGALDVDGGITIDNITIDGTTIALSADDLTIDVAGDIILDADGGDILIKDAGTTIGELGNSSSDFAISATVQDKDIAFKGNDGGATITALTLDISEAGAATFNDKIIMGTNKEVQFVDTNESIKSDGSKLILKSGGTTFNLPASDGSAGQFLKTDGSGTLSFDTVSSAADDLTAGDAAVTLTTTSGNITIDAQGNDSDIIFKGTDGSSDTTFLTIDGSEAGAATFNNKIVATELDISGNIDVDGTTNLDVVDIDGAVDMASTLQVDGAITTSSEMVITTNTNTAQLTLKSTDADANTGPTLQLVRDSGSPADNDLIGSIGFVADDDGGNTFTAFDMFAKVTDVSDGSEDGEMQLRVMVAGTLTDRIKLNADGTTFTGGINVGNTISAASSNLTLDVSGDIVLDADGDNVTIKDGSNTTLDIVSNSTTEVTLDAPGRIILSADDNGEIKFADGASVYGQFKDDSDRLRIEALIQDADIMFVGNDGGSEVTAASFDMSDAGKMTVNNGITVSDGDISFASGHGIDFSATADSGATGATDSSETFKDYEEGDWTPAATNLGMDTIHAAKYTKIGEFVSVYCDITRNSSPSDTSQGTSFGGMPFNAGDDYPNGFSFCATVTEAVRTAASGGSIAVTGLDGVPLTRSQLAGKRCQHYVTFLTL